MQSVSGWAGKMLKAYTGWTQKSQEHNCMNEYEIEYPCGNAMEKCRKGEAHGAHIVFAQLECLPTST